MANGPILDAMTDVIVGEIRSIKNERDRLKVLNKELRQENEHLCRQLRLNEEKCRLFDIVSRAEKQYRDMAKSQLETIRELREKLCTVQKGNSNDEGQ